jgi:ubiquinone/menaquinone biosynthesis C-methylase UbiE
MGGRPDEDMPRLLPRTLEADILQNTLHVHAMQDSSPNEAVKNHYRDCFRLYLRWSGNKGGGYHFGFPLRFRDIFDNSRMTANASERILGLLGISPKLPCKVLDAGCGSGEVALLFKRLFPDSIHKIVGVTLSPEQYAYGQRAIGAQNLSGVELRLGDFHRLPYPPESFDHVVFINSICYSPGTDKVAALAEAARILKPGGKIVFYDVILSQPAPKFPFWWRWSNKALLDAWGVPAWTERETVGAALEKVGLRTVYEKDYRLGIVPSVLSMAFLHLPWFFWNALLGNMPWHEAWVLLRLIIHAPIVGIHPKFHHPIVVWEKIKA